LHRSESALHKALGRLHVANEAASALRILGFATFDARLETGTAAVIVCAQHHYVAAAVVIARA